MRKYIDAFLREKPLFFSFLRPKEVDLYQQFKPFKKPVLDLGCGDGFFAEVAFETVDVGVDPDKKSIEEAKQRKVYKIVKIYNGKKIPYKDGYFSTVVCNSTYEHIPNIEQILKETSRVLKKGGMLYFNAPSDAWPQYLFGSLFLGEIYRNYFIQKSKHWNMYSSHLWEKKLSGLSLDVTYYTYYLDNKKAMWLFDIAHYISIPSLVTKKLFNRWVLFPEKVKYFPWLVDLIEKEIKRNTKRGAYLFIAAKKR